jgi:hypothetical protein
LKKDENDTRPRDLDAHRFVEKNENDGDSGSENDSDSENGSEEEEEIILVLISLQRAEKQAWRGSVIFGLLLVFNYVLEVTLCRRE